MILQKREEIISVEENYCYTHKKGFRYWTLNPVFSYTIFLTIEVQHVSSGVYHTKNLDDMAKLIKSYTYFLIILRIFLGAW